MSRTKINIYELIVLGASMVLLFIPGMYYWEHWKSESVGISKLTMRLSISFMHAAGNTATILGYIILALMIIFAVILLVELFRPQRALNKVVQLSLPVLIIVLYVVFSLLAAHRDSYGYCAPVNVLFYIEIALLLATAILAFLKYSKRITQE